MQKAVSLVVLTLIFLSGCSQFESKVVTQANSAEVMAEADKELPADKAKLLHEALSESGRIPSGMTVGQLIDQQEKREAEWQAESIRADEEWAKVKKQMRESLGFTLESARKVDDPMYSHLAVTYVYKNNSGKDIRAFEGNVVFNDILGNQLEEVDVVVLDPIKAGGIGRKSDRLYFDPYENLRGKKFEDLVIKWEPSEIRFSDGTVEPD